MFQIESCKTNNLNYESGTDLIAPTVHFFVSAQTAHYLAHISLFCVKCL